MIKSKRHRISLAVADIRVVRHFGGDGECLADGWSVKTKILHGGLGCPHIALSTAPTAPDLGWCFERIQEALTKREFQDWLREYRRAAPRNLPEWGSIAEIAMAKIKVIVSKVFAYVLS